MRNTVALLALLAATVSAAELRLIPAPRVVKLGTGKLALPSPAPIVLRSSAPEDKFAVAQLGVEIKTVTRSEGVITIGRAGDPAIDAAIDARKLDRTALKNPEGYLLDVTPAGVLLASRTAAGLFYGVQTLRQLIQGGSLPVVSIADWPALRVRGLMIDTSQGAVLSPTMLKTAVRMCAAYKLNLVNLYVEHLFPFSHSPITADGAALSFEEMRQLVAYARQYHVDLVPQQESFGHLHSLLKWELYSGMAETKRGDVLTPGDERSQAWVLQAAKELAAVFPSPYLHIGADETFELGLGRSREKVQSMGMGKVYTEHIRKVAGLLQPVNKKLIIWGDIAKKNPEAISELPKDLIIATWGYKAEDDFASFITPFRKAGLEVWVCPGVGNWRRMFPDFTEAASNINNFVAEGKKLGATGMLNTHWNDHGEELFNLSWHGIVFGAAASWQPGKVDPAAFDAAFDWAFYRNDGAQFITIIRRLEGINHVLASADLKETDNNLAWIDPFSPRGAQTTRKLLPVASEIRRRAEQSLVDLHLHSSRARLHAETLPFLRFAARRLDLLGMKAQLSKDISDFYLEARQKPDLANHNLREISGRSGVGRVHDIMDATSELKAALRNLWPMENRPFYLDSLLVRYDHELLYWHQKKLLFAELRGGGKALPTPESLNLVLP